MGPSVTVSARGADRIRRSHPWIYRSDVTHVAAGAGDAVRVVDARGRFLAYALYSDRSQIAIRVVSTTESDSFADAWFQRLEQAIAFRASLQLTTDAYRLVHGEADLLPSLVVDRYGDYLVVQTLSQGTERLATDTVRWLVERLSPRGILARNDPRVRQLEGLEPVVELLHGAVPATVDVHDDGVVMRADLWKGQKTGLFLDQRENRAAAAAYASGRLLDCFSYNGSFALRLSRTCSSVTAIDVAADATDRIRDNAARNGREMEVRTGNVFDELREYDRADERFDTIVLDPPAFAKTKAAVPKALAGYKEINLRALKLLRPGGYLITCSCSYHVDEAMLGEVVFGAALDAGATVAVVEKRMQGRDHPVLLGVPETYYLKCFILRRLA
ncbi:MAG: class I SAM-dependent rRNA methyltransferase [Vicinamibacterales bacterium]